jgi:hypothetical protein
MNSKESRAGKEPSINSPQEPDRRGIFTTVPASDESSYKAYRLTRKGRALLPLVAALRQWDEERTSPEANTTFSIKAGQDFEPWPRGSHAVLTSRKSQ